MKQIQLEKLKCPKCNSETYHELKGHYFLGHFTEEKAYRCKICKHWKYVPTIRKGGV